MDGYGSGSSDEDSGSNSYWDVGGALVNESKETGHWVATSDSYNAVYNRPDSYHTPIGYGEGTPIWESGSSGADGTVSSPDAVGAGIPRGLGNEVRSVGTVARDMGGSARGVSGGESSVGRGGGDVASESKLASRVSVNQERCRKVEEHQVRGATTSPFNNAPRFADVTASNRSLAPHRIDGGDVTTGGASSNESDVEDFFGDPLQGTDVSTSTTTRGHHPPMSPTPHRSGSRTHRRILPQFHLAPPPPRLRSPSPSPPQRSSVITIPSIALRRGRNHNYNYTTP